MRLIKVGLANIDTNVGAFDSNMDKVWEFAQRMSQEHCTIGAFPEQVVGGYAPEDLVLRGDFVRQQEINLYEFAKRTADLNLPTVFVVGLTMAIGSNLYNVAAVVCNGDVVGVVPKEKLPTYGVFYENRTLTHGIPYEFHDKNVASPFGDMIFKFPFGTMAVEVCEDIWSPDGPMRRRSYSGAEVVVNISSSPFRSGVTATRAEMISTRAADNQVTVVYVNQVGGQDSLVYDGGGFVNQNGRMLLSAKRWQEQLSTQVVDLDRTTRQRRQNTTWRTDCEVFRKENRTVEVVTSHGGPGVDNQNYKYPVPSNRSFFIPESNELIPSPKDQYFRDLVLAMQTGLEGYFEKSRAFDRIIIGLSGGKDSALVLMIAWAYAQKKFAALEREAKKAAIRDFIRCYSMPSRFNSETTRSIAKELAEELGVSFVEVPIDTAFAHEVVVAQALLPEGVELSAIAKQNIQARIRGERMWTMSNSLRGLWIQTSNMSEKAVGYTTIGGDMMGSYSLIANLPKTVVIALLGYLAEETRFTSLWTLLKTKASAELDENQEDEKDLMPFPVLDALLDLFAGEALMPDEVYQVIRSMWTDAEFLGMRADFQPEMLKAWVVRFVELFQNSIFKWVQTPQTVHLGSLDLDRERALQLPVIQSREWLKLEELRKSNT